MELGNDRQLISSIHMLIKMNPEHSGTDICGINAISIIPTTALTDAYAPTRKLRRGHRSPAEFSHRAACQTYPANAIVSANNKDSPAPRKPIK
jgi:hypothetical protein